jgi:hypothetical protein
MKKGSKLQRDPQKLASELEQLGELNSEELRERWQTLFGAEPPPKLRSSLIVQGIAYRLQQKALGGLKPATVRLLERIADDAAARREAAHRRRGVELLGYCYEGHAVIARAICDSELKCLERNRNPSSSTVT